MKKKKWIWIGVISLCLVAGGQIYIATSPGYLGKSKTWEVRDARNENILYTSHYGQMVPYVSLEEVSPSFLSCLIAMEDRKFYQHHGLDYARIASSLWQNAQKGEIVSGASTITQQLARTLYLTQEQTVSRKIKEARIALNLERKYSKNEILEAYVNCAFFGHNLYGVEAASQYFYHKNAKDLTLGEGSMLVGVLSAPNVYSPDIDYALSKEKQLQVLTRTKEEGKISEEEKTSAYQEELKIYGSLVTDCDSLPFYHDAILYQMEQEELITSARDLHGYTITSYLDLDIQKTIEQVIASKQFALEEEVSVVVMKPYSSHVLAIVGGKDYATSSYHRALFSSRQMGSTVKPLLYYLALEYGFSPSTKFKSEPTVFHIDGVGEYAPSNATHTYANRPISLVEAISLSDNIYATKTNLFLGSDTLGRFLRYFGIEVESGPTSGLGTDAITPLQLCAIYNAFASEGDYYEPSFFSAVSLQDGTSIYQKEKGAKFSLNEENVKILSYLLRSPFDPFFRSYATPTLLHYQPKHTFAAKSGTTESDAYVVGYNPRYTILVHVGTESNTPMKNGNFAKEIWREIADRLCEKYQDQFYEMGKEFTPFHFEKYEKKSFTYYTLS